MDALGLTYLANSPSKTEKKEQFNSDTSYSVVHFISIIVSLVIGCIAATLSWNCNTAKGVNIGLKIIFAFFAFIFGLIYIILYLVFLSDCGRVTN